MENQNPNPQNPASVDPSPPTLEKPKRKPPLSKILVAGTVILFSVIAFSLMAYLVMSQNKSTQTTDFQTSTSGTTPSPHFQIPSPIVLKTAADTSNWKTYRNTKIGFEIKSPLGAKVPPPGNTGGGPPVHVSEFVYFDGVEDQSDRNTILFNDYELLIYSSNHTLQDLIKNETSDEEITMQDWSNFYTNYSNSKRTLLDLNGVKIVKVVTLENENVNIVSDGYYHTGPPKYQIYYEFIDNNYWFIFTRSETEPLSSVDVEKGKAAEKEMEKILSTFKFTDQNSAVDTSTWKTYQSIAGDFTINYPQDWMFLDDDRDVVFGPPNIESITEDSNIKLLIELQKPNTKTGIIDAKSYVEYMLNYGSDIDRSSVPFTLNEISGYKVIDSTYDKESIIFDRNNLIYYIKYSTSKNNEKDMSNVQKAISTFEFTK